MKKSGGKIKNVPGAVRRVESKKGNPMGAMLASTERKFNPRKLRHDELALDKPHGLEGEMPALEAHAAPPLVIKPDVHLPEAQEDGEPEAEEHGDVVHGEDVQHEVHGDPKADEEGQNVQPAVHAEPNNEEDEPAANERVGDKFL